MRKLNKVIVLGAVLTVSLATPAWATMNLETGAAVSGISIALNNYYARTMEPESALAESVKMVANDTIVLEEQKDTMSHSAVKKLVEDVTPVEEEIVKEGEGGVTWGTVKGTASLRLRDNPNSDAKTLTLLAKGEHYIVTGQEGQFLKIKVDEDLEGYVFKEYVDTSISYDEELEAQKKALAAEAEKAKKEAEEALKKLEEVKKATEVKDKNNETTKAAETTKEETTKAVETKVESKPETKAETKSETKKETEKDYETVEALDWEDDETEEETEEDTLEEIEAPDDFEDEDDDEDEVIVEAPEKTTISSSSGGPGGVSSATRTAIVAYAKQFLGNPYVFGGTSLTNGCDCSGFTMKIYEYFGYNIGRSSRDQALKGTSINESSAQPGDLYFYDSGGTINHVAMYIGGGQVIHASNSTTGIIISSAHYRTPCKICTFLK